MCTGSFQSSWPIIHQSASPQGTPKFAFSGLLSRIHSDRMFDRAASVSAPAPGIVRLLRARQPAPVWRPYASTPCMLLLKVLPPLRAACPHSSAVSPKLAGTSSGKPLSISTSAQVCFNAAGTSENAVFPRIEGAAVAILTHACHVFPLKSFVSLWRERTKIAFWSAP